MTTKFTCAGVFRKNTLNLRKMFIVGSFLQINGVKISTLDLNFSCFALDRLLILFYYFLRLHNEDNTCVRVKQTIGRLTQWLAQGRSEVLEFPVL